MYTHYTKTHLALVQVGKTLCYIEQEMCLAGERELLCLRGPPASQLRFEVSLHQLGDEAEAVRRIATGREVRCT